MQLKRGFFIGALLVLFLCCYHNMNQHYDELARYQYVNDDNRKLILEYLDTEEINFLIERQYKPEEFMSYLGIEDFNIRYLDWYNQAIQNDQLGIEETIQVVNQLKNKMNYSQFLEYLKHYSVSQLSDFYLEDSDFVHDLKLVNDPSSIIKEIPASETLFTYYPNDLVVVEEIPAINSTQGSETFQLRKETNDHLIMLCQAAFEINEKTCGNMVMTQGYVSFEQQEMVYEDVLLRYGIDDVKKYADYPGKSLFQLGTVLKLVPVSLNEDDISSEKTAQQIWLEEHAKNFGFEFINASNNRLKEFVLQYNPKLLMSDVKTEGNDNHD